MGECDETVAGQVSLWTWINGSREFTGSWLEQQPDFSTVQVPRDVCDWCHTG